MLIVLLELLVDAVSVPAVGLTVASEDAAGLTADTGGPISDIEAAAVFELEAEGTRGSVEAVEEPRTITVVEPAIGPAVVGEGHAAYVAEFDPDQEAEGADASVLES
ncbi:uncharacterized protein MYCGRDRAFT_96731 [Zymoseptoria tritici IPO323]|uniref:Secreted protein n=1 Tax=Zymoseptoria tritici (strain CBS 115943 / IPO323) TaxID=336722 RepID=F9XNB5_ZYMTI|nr:uncharacterized protein MYCGRDRAFT_96731 [Zymoseptoria tritici IPO323]EGP83386.1 hypothetical protein MYCGRDRAFT_96731 [Zymoseptoria tritici IPO323]